MIRSTLFLFAAAMIGLPGCVSEGGGGTSYVTDIIRPTGQASNTVAVQHCELVNGPVGCNNERYNAIQSYIGQLESYPESPPNTVAQMEAISEGFDIIAAAEKGKAYQPPGGRPFTPVDGKTTAPLQSVPADVLGGGCEYQGRDYGPGESVYSPIDSDSLFVFGERFSDLAGRSGPWQQCQCSSSSGHWGCV